MKFIILAALVLMPMTSPAQTANYKVLEGKLHKSGEVQAEVLPIEDTFTVRMNYSIKKKKLVPIPDSKLKGETVLDLPVEFRDERGYLELESKLEIETNGAVVKFVKRLDYKEYKEAYHAEVHLKNGKSKMTIVYHPEIPGLGWARVEIIFMSDVNLLNNYLVVAEIDDAE